MRARLALLVLLLPACIRVQRRAPMIEFQGTMESVAEVEVSGEDRTESPFRPPKREKQVKRKEVVNLECQRFDAECVAALKALRAVLMPMKIERKEPAK